MKIVFLSRLFLPHIGGVEKHVMEISRVLIAKGHSVTVITEKYDIKLPLTETINDIAVYRIDAGLEDTNKKLRIWKEIQGLQQVIKDADVVHCHDVFFWYLPFRFLYPRKPVFTTFHGYESYPIRKSAMRMRKLSERLSWGNICIGDFIPKWYGTNPTFVSYGAVNVTKNDSGHARMINESALFIGRLDEQTGALEYAKAVFLLQKKYPKFEFTLIGNGKDRKRLEKQFRVLGFQKEPEKYFFKHHFAFVSRYLSILEAFAAKKLVFAIYDNPVKEDYLRLAPFSKWIVIVQTPEQLAEQVAYYLKNPEKENKMIEDAYQWVKKQTWESMVSLYLNLWMKKIKT